MRLTANHWISPSKSDFFPQPLFANSMLQLANKPTGRASNALQRPRDHSQSWIPWVTFRRSVGQLCFSMSGFLSFMSATLFEYETQKVVQITSKKVGLIFRAIQLGFVLYIILWVMWWEKGYQSFDSVVSGVTAKLKGVVFTNLTDYPAIGARIWDVADYVVPPQQNKAFFVITNVVVTPNQQQGRCEEDSGVYKISCKRDADCERGELVIIGSGMKTGRCVPSTRTANMSVCEVYAWCPTENDRLPIKGKAVLQNAQNYTVLIKNSIEFPRYKVKRRNILSWMKPKFLYTCRYNKDHPRNRFCPIMKLADIVRYGGEDSNNIWIYGGMVSINIDWSCNLDYDVEKCVPEYTFRRLDNPNEKVGKGWNFRYSYHYEKDGVPTRTLVKAYGIQVSLICCANFSFRSIFLKMFNSFS